MHKTYSNLCRVLLAILFAAAAPGLVRAQSAAPVNPANIAGVMTRWQTSSKTACQDTYDEDADQTSCARSLMFTITPNLVGLRLHDWVTTLASAGVNTGVIYVIPGYRLAANATISQSEWSAYNQYIYMAPASLNDAEKRVLLEVGKAISARQYTVAQRNYAILTFLQQLQNAFPGTAPIQFILDERVWFINHLDASGMPVRQSMTNVFAIEQNYSSDIAGIVQMAAAAHVDRWISGIRLSEYASKDWNLMGPVMVDLVTQINAESSGWMKTHFFIGAGGGWGQDWKGVNTMKCPQSAGWKFAPCKGAFPFFQYMSQQVGYFAFGDKFMEFGKPEQYMMNRTASGMEYTYVTGEVTDFCKQNTANYVCKNLALPTITDWLAFLEDDVDGLGFSDLINFVQQNAQAYPKLTNVIFEGDNADSIATMTLPPAINGGAALANLFRSAMHGSFENVETGKTTVSPHHGTWTGKIFLDGYDDLSTVPRPGFYGDAGLSMFDTNYNDFLFAPTNVQIIPLKNATANWLHWP